MSSSFSRREFVQLVGGSLPVLAGLNDPESPPPEPTPFPVRRLTSDWPALKQYGEARLRRIAMPLGGIGTGTVSIGGRGDLRDWEVVNRPAKGFVPSNTFFAIHAQAEGGEPYTRVLEGPVPPEDFEGPFGVRLPNHGLPRFDQAHFSAAYPLAQVLLTDGAAPVDVRIEAFNPLVPADVDASAHPAAILRFVLENRSGVSVKASVCGSLGNFIGTDGSQGKTSRNTIAFRDGNDVRGLVFASDGVSPAAEQWGTLALTVFDDVPVTYTRSWGPDIGWSTQMTDFWDEFSATGRLTDRGPADADAPTGSLAAALTVPPGSSRSLTFLLTWHFPNRRTWTPAEGEADPPCDEADGSCCALIPNCVGNHYTTVISDAWQAAERIAAQLPRLEERTVAFVRAVCESDLPDVVKEAALFNLSTLRSQTTFRTADGRFFGFEGCGDTWGCCHGSCTHVWNYEQATAFLFGRLARSMRETEFLLATDEQGLMSFRVNLPLEKAQQFGKAAADGQMGCLMKLYRDWQLSGDDGFLRSLWPAAKAALSFAWIPGGWDADRDGVMEGAQHNTMDVEYYGPNPQMQLWYLGALRATEEMARHVGENDFALECRRVFESGRAWTDAHLFNGQYYEHTIRPPMSVDNVAPALLVGMGARDLTSPDFQLGRGCLVDQLVGQFLAHVCGLGYLADPGHIRTTLASIMTYNFREELSDHFNNMRTFALADEAGLLMASYPLGDRPERPFPYYNEIMTGFEYAAAVHMLYEGLLEDGLKAMTAIRARYDGRRRNPFNEAECGNHYARAMASWGAVLALTGFRYSAVTQTLTFAAPEQRVRWMWSSGHAWGTISLTPQDAHMEAILDVLGGVLPVASLNLDGFGSARLEPARALREGESERFSVLAGPQ